MIASGSADGQLIVRNLIEGTVDQPYRAEIILKDRSIKSALTVCRFSMTKRNVMATAYESGVVVIWDLSNLDKPMRHKYFAHSQECTGLAFSPVNNLLLCSAGKDGRIHFFDIVDCKEVK